MKSGNTTAQLKARNGRRQASFDPKKDSDAREKALFFIVDVDCTKNIAIFFYRSRDQSRS